MTDDWYERLRILRASFFDGAEDEVRRARAIYRDIVGQEAIVRLTLMLGLTLTEGGQDWAIEVAEGARTAEFLDCYETRLLDEDERHYLLELIIASLDDHLNHIGPADDLSGRLRHHLLTSFDAHRYSVKYWAQLDDPEATRFAVSPLMREIWQAAGAAPD
ncbi:MAG TPA: hypothetical protein PKA20_14320 [Burkholderiaceae bacterium]|nr:hypothetical protein [Burkholderiaceae bacterium]